MPERERLITSDEGKAAYEKARASSPLAERLGLFERIINDALRSRTHEQLLLDKYVRSRPAAERVHITALLAPAAASWRTVADESRVLADGDVGLEAATLLRTSARRFQDAAHAASRGGDDPAAEAFDDGCSALTGAVSVLARNPSLQVPHAAAVALLDRVKGSWPTPTELSNFPSQDDDAYLAAGRQTRDLSAIACWLAPHLGQECEAAGLDSTHVRAIGNTLDRAGGGLEHLAPRWPEERAKLQAMVHRLEAAQKVHAERPAGEAAEPGSSDHPFTPTATHRFDRGGRYVTLNGKSLKYMRADGKQRTITVRHSAVRLLVGILVRGKPVRSSRASVAELNEALDGPTDRSVRVEWRGSADHSLTGESQVSITKSLRGACGY